MIAAVLLTAAAVVVVLALALGRAAGRPDPVDHAYNTLPAGRPELRIDTATGSHDQLPIREDIRQVLVDYCEGMWQHTQEQP